jgi:hypothetical protein
MNKVFSTHKVVKGASSSSFIHGVTFDGTNRITSSGKYNLALRKVACKNPRHVYKFILIRAHKTIGRFLTSDFVSVLFV